MSLGLFFYLLLFVAPVGAIIHECGHMLGAVIVKADNINLSIGTGKRMTSYSMKRISVDIHLLLFVGGVAKSERRVPFSKKESAIITISGPLINLIMASLVSVIYNYNSYVNLFILFNAWLALINVIPFKMKHKQSDGYKILNLLFSG